MQPVFSDQSWSACCSHLWPLPPGPQQWLALDSVLASVPGALRVPGGISWHLCWMAVVWCLMAAWSGLSSLCACDAGVHGYGIIPILSPIGLGCAFLASGRRTFQLRTRMKAYCLPCRAIEGPHSSDVDIVVSSGRVPLRRVCASGAGRGVRLVV